MNINTKNAYTEVLAVIDLLDNDYKNKIPNKLIEFFAKEKSNEHRIEINPDIPLEEQKLLQETIDILAMLKLSYWCCDEGEKQELLNILDENEKRDQEKLREKYNPDNLFKNRSGTKCEERNEEEQRTAMVEYKKPNFIIMILDKIRKLFIKKA